MLISNNSSIDFLAIILFVLAATIGAIYWVDYEVAKQEISADEYLLVGEYLSEYPRLSEKILEKPEEFTITVGEYNKIKAAYDEKQASAAKEQIISIKTKEL